MIDYVQGAIASLTPTEIVVDNNGIGYIASISLQTYAAFENLKEGKVFFHHILREDEELDYGFATRDERELFRLLISVSGVGAATARMMLSSLTCEEIRTAILADDVRKIQSVKGIGAKSAQKVIIELRDKIGRGAGADNTVLVAGATSGVADEAMTALIMLGFNKTAVSKALSTILKKDPAAPVESLIKQALQIL